MALKLVLLKIIVDKLGRHGCIFFAKKRSRQEIMADRNNIKNLAASALGLYCVQTQKILCFFGIRFRLILLFYFRSFCRRS